MLSWLNSTAKKIHPECITHDLELVFVKVLISVFQCCNFLKTVHSHYVILNKQYSKKNTSRVHQTWLELVFGNVVISVFQCRNLLKTVHSDYVILNKQHPFFLHSKCIKHDLELVFGKVFISVFQCCNLLKTVHSDYVILNKQYSNKHKSRVHQTWFRACFWKCGYFCISMLKFAENCPQCSNHTE
jgi:RNase P subunit RPR2